MKELSIEEKAKAYNKVREKIALRFGSNVAEEIFSEFEMSEDEKIRKGIIDFLWKEKIFLQEAHSSVENNPKYRFVMDAIAWLEKQGEHTDKVEPKFQNGQWIVWQNKCYKVNYNGCGYELIDQNGLSTSLEYGTVDKSAHLWTIQDAKDGDVLQLGVVTVIFQEYICNGNCKCYYSVCNGEFEIPTKDESYGTFNATPATKEQRDTLEKAITNAGYRWDKEKLKLEKI